MSCPASLRVAAPFCANLRDRWKTADTAFSMI
jgi:hypothetical protein